MTRRELTLKMGALAGLAAVSPRLARAQAPQAIVPARSSPPSVISNPPRDFSPGAPPVTYPDPDLITVDRRSTRCARQYTDPAPVDRRLVDGRTGLVQPGPLPRLERHPEQPSAAVSR
jgi:hypothetical protein